MRSGDLMSNEIDCPHKQDGLCQISTNLAGIPVPLADDACAACVLQKNPRTINRVTCSKAIHVQSISGLVPNQELLDCVNPPKQGVGTELERLIERTRSILAFVRLDWIVPTSVNCGCNATRSRMNADGPAACIANRQFHASDILERWEKHFPPIRFFPFTRSIIATYIRRAVQITRRKETSQ